ncbi:MAG: flagellar hook-basal body protein [Oscillospiraceae bacterium]
MIDAFYTAAVGTAQTQKAMDVIANNMSNLNTYGYKSSQSSFSDLLYTHMRPSTGLTNNGFTTQIPGQTNPPDGINPNDRLKVGHGAKLKKTDTIYTGGVFTPTGRGLDYAIQNDGFFAIETTNGIKYTRNGNFEKTQLGDKFYLTSSQGGCVLDSQGQRIEVPEGLNEAPNLPIGVFKFENQDGLVRESAMLFSATDNSGEAVSIANPEQALKQSYLEASNVDIAQSMSDVIIFQRSFQYNAKMVQTADEIMQTVNGLRQ